MMLCPQAVFHAFVTHVALSVGLIASRLFLAALLDALAAGVQRALSSSLLGQLLASLLVCRKVVRVVPYS
jgi:hypothetical protein